jgi:hypothetical protein
MAADRAWRPCRLAFGAAGRTGSPEPFSALTAEVYPVGIVKTALGTLHYHLHVKKELLTAFNLMKCVSV